MASLDNNQWQYQQSSRCHVSIRQLLHQLDIHPNKHMDSPMVTHLLRHKVIQLLVIPQLLIHNMAILGDVITTLLVDLQCQVIFQCYMFVCN